MSLRAITLLLVPVVLVSGCRGGAGPGAGGTPVVAASPGRLSVVMADVEARPVERTIRFVGTLHADAQAEVATEVDGRLVSIAADLGDAVEEGQVLATIDDLARAARLEEAEAVLARAVAEEKRGRRLREKGVMSQQEFDQIASAAAVARARREVLAIELERTRIRAPFAGRIAERRADVGSYVRTGTPLFVLVADRPLRLRGEVPERYASEVAIGNEVRGTVAAYPDERIVGTLRRISAAADPESRALAVEAEMPNEQGKLRPGFFCEAEILVHRHDLAVVVPVDAVVDFAGVTRVFVIDDAGVAHSRPIEAGLRFGSRVEVLDGLAAGERVATSALGRLVDGTPVAEREPATRQEPEKS